MKWIEGKQQIIAASKTGSWKEPTKMSILFPELRHHSKILSSGLRQVFHERELQDGALTYDLSRISDITIGHDEHRAVTVGVTSGEALIGQGLRTIGGLTG